MGYSASFEVSLSISIYCHKSSSVTLDYQPHYKNKQKCHSDKLSTIYTILFEHTAYLYSLSCYKCTLYIIQEKLTQKLMQVYTTTIQSLKQQSDKVHCCHQDQRAHHHGSTTKNLRTLAAGDRLVVWIAVVRCSIVTHYIGKFISWCGAELLKWKNSRKRVIFTIVLFLPHVGSMQNWLSVVLSCKIPVHWVRFNPHIVLCGHA